MTTNTETPFHQMTTAEHLAEIDRINAAIDRHIELGLYFMASNGHRRRSAHERAIGLID